MKHQLLCGCGKVSITPPIRLLPRLFGLRDAVFGEINDELYVRTIAFSDGERKILLVSFDLDKAPCPEEFVTELAERTGIPEAGILFTAVHSASVPLVGKRPSELRYDAAGRPPQVQEAVSAYEQLIHDALMEAASNALESLQPVRIGFAAGKSYINVNRCCLYTLTGQDGSECVMCETGVNPEGPVDRTLSVLRADRLDGTPAAFFLNYPVHCNTMLLNDRGDGRSAVSGDIGGVVSASMEQRFPGSVAIWTSGAAGDLNPLLMTQFFYPHPATGEPVSSKVQGLEVSRAFLNSMAGQHLSDIMKVLRGLRCRQERGEIQFALDTVQVPGQNAVLGSTGGSPASEPYCVRLHLLRVGDIALVGVNGELFSSLGSAMRDASPLKHTMIVTHDSSLLPGTPDYILDDETIQMCQSAQIIRLPHSGFRAMPGLLKAALQAGTAQIFQKAGRQGPACANEY